MAAGDDAAAKSLQVFTGNEDADTIHVLLNIRGDDIAHVIDMIQALPAAPTWATLAGKPAVFAAAPHAHAIGEISGLQAAIDYIYTGHLDPAVYSRLVGGNSVYIDSGGTLGHLPSARKWKKNIRRAPLDPTVIRNVLIRAYQYRADVGLGDDVQVGVIADELEALGLNWLVGYDEDGQAMTVHYDRIGLLALALAQDSADRLDKLTERVSLLEGNV